MANNTYTVDYAPTSKAGCKFSQCKLKIEKGQLRIGKSFPSDRFTEGGTSNNYYHPQCWFEAQKKTKKTTKKVESEDDLQGFDVISAADQKLILDLLKHKDDPPLHSPKKKAKKADGGGGGGGTPKKQTKQVYVDSDEDMNKKTKQLTFTTASSNTNKNKSKKTISESDGEESEDLEKDAWGAVAANGSRVAKVLNSTDISQVSVMILASASKEAIKRAANQDDQTFEQEFGGDPDAYLQWLAGTGVLWISTDFDDAGFTSPGLWVDALSQIVRQIFMQKPKKGLVVALWGPETKHFKSEIKKHYQDTMGTVKYRVIDGPTPLNAAFNSKDELSKIDDARTLLSMHALHWWPFEGEVARKKEETKELEKKKKKDSSRVVGEGGVLWVLECNEEGEIRVDLTGGPTELGRHLVNNKKISRKQCVVDTADDGVELTPLGVNPMTLSRAGSEDVEILSRNEKYTLHEGDSFTLCGEQYRFVVQRPTAGSSGSKATPEKEKEKAKQPAKQPSKIDEGGEGEKTKVAGDKEEEENQMEEEEKHENGAEKHDESEKKEEGEGEEKSPEQGVKRKSSDISTTTTATSGKKTPSGSAESDSATVPFSAGYDSPEESKAKPKQKAEPKPKQKVEPKKEEVDDVVDDVVDDEEVARKLQEQLDKEEAEAAKAKKPKSKPNTPEKDAEYARKLQEKLNKESGGKNKRKQEDDDDDDGEVNWAAKVKKQKKSKKGSDEDDDWTTSAPADSDSDEDYQEEDSDDDGKKKQKKGSTKKPPCKYGKACYRTNPDHLKNFSHPK